MQVQIKREKSVDKEEYNLLLRKVYNDETLLKHVDDVKNSDVFVPQLSCIAKIKDSIIGTILYTKTDLICGDKNHAVLILTHLAVLPAYQGFGIGSELISNSFTRAQQLGYHTIFVLGLEDYFNRFGFDRADMYKIVTSLRIEDEELLIIKLAPEGLNYNNGRLVTHPLVRSIFQLIV